MYPELKQSLFHNVNKAQVKEEEYPSCKTALFHHFHVKVYQIIPFISYIFQVSATTAVEKKTKYFPLHKKMPEYGFLLSSIFLHRNWIIGSVLNGKMQVRENSYSGIIYTVLAKDVNLDGLSKNLWNYVNYVIMGNYIKLI